MVYVKDNRGLTLVELLIVIAILGLLAAVVIVAIDPLEQFARTRDALRKSTVGQLGHAIEGYVISQGGTSYPPIVAFQSALKDQGHIVSVINSPSYQSGISPCAPSAGGSEGNYCYQTDTTSQAVVWVRLESKSEGGKGVPRCSGGNVAYWVYSTANGQAGRVCATNGAFTSDYAPTFDP